ncbi:heavy metal translocating P-type ATPase metal-binding domain-containing protein [Undibacterium sp. CY18W]|uniref:Heavy metal translocating P-type ATPase metal-binding domain-containing protein n=1 Tax=Undibacterium hunanense TaxID=2762292 RepID=A0ABR6ZK61_9BURK|nr:heavy metal translocating P-type ATPase metal-binding domain-containing protein [Undibacterium hunanense]MBC3916291.1 heavy metal translocating P-type ATPase metal-binding domain-containing protein [Undibacterium hunanense]
MAFAFLSRLETGFLSLRTGGRLNCFHCDETMRERNALTVTFNGSPQQVCCHGCLAILRTIEQNHLVAAYLKNKARLSSAG